LRGIDRLPYDWMMMQARSQTHPGTVAIAVLVMALLTGTLVDAISNSPEAAVFNIGNQAVPEISIRVGNPGATINRVDFDVSNSEVGDGTPVAGSQQITIRLVIRAPASSPLTGFLTVDSSTPLVNSSGATIPVSEISWTARDGDIPSGSFGGSTNQLLASFTSSTRVVDRHSFSYANRNIHDAGTYNGQVTYTWSAP
jgi:hypothetical protein